MKTLYQEGNSFLHKLYPITKVYYALGLMILQSIFSSNLVTALLILLNIVLLINAKVVKKTLSLLKFVLFILLTMVIIQGLFSQSNATVLFQIGKVAFYKEGLLIVLKSGLNIINIVLSFSILIVTTKPSDLVEAFISKGLSPRIGYVLISVFQIVTEMLGTVETITDAQRSRGLQTEGNLITRAKAFIPLLGPVVMSSFVGTRERSMALEVRGFSSTAKKSFLNEFNPTKTDKFVNYLVLGLLLISIIYRIIRILA